MKIKTRSLYCNYMNDTQKMLKILINGQSSLRQDLTIGLKKVSDRIDKFEKQINKKIDEKVDNLEKRLTERIDKIGLAEAELEEDTPTREEFDGLEKRVSKVEVKVALA